MSEGGGEREGERGRETDRAKRERERQRLKYPASVPVKSAGWLGDQIRGVRVR